MGITIIINRKVTRIRSTYNETEPKIDIVIIYAQIEPDCQVFLNQFSHRDLMKWFNTPSCKYFIKNMCEPAKIDGFWNN